MSADYFNFPRLVYPCPNLQTLQIEKPTNDIFNTEVIMINLSDLSTSLDWTEQQYTAKDFSHYHSGFLKVGVWKNQMLSFA